MVQHDCTAFRSNETRWSFCPDLSANYIFVALFGLSMLAHIVQAIRSKRRNCWVIVASASFQFGAYITRGFSIKLPSNQWLFLAWNVLLMTAPLWTNAFVYLLIGHLASQSTSSTRLLNRLPRRHIPTVFICLDIVAFVIQSTGIVLATRPNASMETISQGIHVYMAGICTQQCFILLFCFVLYKFSRGLAGKQDKRSTQRCVWLLYVVLALLSVRIMFRLVEFSRGISSAISKQELYVYCFDSVPMLVALLLFNVFHPARSVWRKDEVHDHV